MTEIRLTLVDDRASVECKGKIEEQIALAIIALKDNKQFRELILRAMNRSLSLLKEHYQENNNGTDK